MGDVFRQKYRRKDGRSGESAKWYGEYTDHTGKRRRVPLAKDKVAARAMLRELEKQAERRRAGIADDFTEAATTPLGELKAQYLADLKLRGRSDRYRHEVEQLLTLVLKACGFTAPGELRAGPLDLYLATMEGSARTKAKHRQVAVGFAHWLVRKRQLPANPLEGSTRPEGDETRKRRALTADELRKVVTAAKDRPLREALLIRWGPRTGELARRLKPADIERLRIEGEHNALLYRTAFYSGLRANELRSLRVSDLVLTGPHPRLHLPGSETKNSEDASLPLPRHLATDLAAWIADRQLGDDDRVFRVRRDTARVLRADLAAAGIPYRDGRGRVADFHSLRASLASHLNAAGVAATTAKNFLRHSTITLTADTYHDAAMDDLRGAAEGLPEV
jgi:integrase